MITPESWYTSLNLATIATSLMVIAGALLIIAAKMSDRSDKKSK